MASPRIAGAISFQIDGTTYDLASDFTYTLPGWSRESLVNLNGPADGFKSKGFHGRVFATIRDARNISVADFQNMEDVTIIAHLANGKTVQGTGMWNTEAVEVNAVDATYTLQFEGRDLSEA